MKRLALTRCTLLNIISHSITGDGGVRIHEEVCLERFVLSPATQAEDGRNNPRKLLQLLIKVLTRIDIPLVKVVLCESFSRTLDSVPESACRLGISTLSIRKMLVFEDLAKDIQCMDIFLVSSGGSFKERRREECLAVSSSASCHREAYTGDE